MVVGFFKKTFFSLRNQNQHLSNFENLIFPKNLFDFESKFPFWGQKFLTKMSVQNPKYPVKKILDGVFTESLGLLSFLTASSKFDLFLRPLESKKEYRTGEGVLKNFLEKNLCTLSLWMPKRLAK